MICLLDRFSLEAPGSMAKGVHSTHVTPGYRSHNRARAQFCSAKMRNVSPCADAINAISEANKLIVVLMEVKYYTSVFILVNVIKITKTLFFFYRLKSAKA